jgi:predicted Zn-dependent protease
VKIFLIKALALMQAGNLTEAEPLLKEIITSNKNFHESFHLLGMIYATEKTLLKPLNACKEKLYELILKMLYIILTMPIVCRMPGKDGKN